MTSPAREQRGLPTTTDVTEAVATPFSIDPATQMGLVAVAVSNLDRSLVYYTTALGFTLLAREDGRATLGAGSTPLLLLTEQPGARPFPLNRYGYTGLYHFAILTPSRRDLGRWLRHWLELGLPLPGQGDHLVSEALYLVDPDGNGIEVYRDRPRSEWTWVNGQVQMATDPVDIEGLLEEAARDDEPWSGFPEGTRLGHMHLQVADIPQAAAFYHGLLGFDIVAAMPSALFISAGGYHHHIGMNNWHSRGAGPAPADMAGLRFFTIEMPSEEARAAVVARLAQAGVATREVNGAVVAQDPWSNTLVFTIGVASPDAAPGLWDSAARE